jgi:hypothetical protein
MSCHQSLQFIAKTPSTYARYRKGLWRQHTDKPTFAHSAVKWHPKSQCAVKEAARVSFYRVRFAALSTTMAWF